MSGRPLGGGVGTRVFAAIVSATLLSQYYRATTGVIAPELMADVGLTAEQLGLLSGVFFVVLTAMQIPVGLMFDRWGPRRTIAGLTAVAVAGSVWFALATTPAGLIGARVLIGLGCAGSFMGAVVLCSRWYDQDRFTGVLSLVFALSNVGTLLATTPLAAATELFGWRTAFLLSAALTALVGLLFWMVVRDAPPDHPAAAREPERLGAIARGLAEVWRTPGLLPVLGLHTMAYAAMLTVLGLWAGPYLNDVHGLDPVARGNIVLLMACGQIAGLLFYGPLDRLFGTRKYVVMAGAAVAATALGLLAALESPPLALAAVLLVLLCFASGYTIVIVSHGRSLFPDRLIGRGVTTVNLAQAVGAAILPIVTGAIVGALTPLGATTAPEIAYRAAFACLAVLLLAGLAVYSRSRDTKPGVVAESAGNLGGAIADSDQSSQKGVR